MTAGAGQLHFWTIFVLSDTKLNISAVIHSQGTELEMKNFHFLYNYILMDGLVQNKQ